MSDARIKGYDRSSFDVSEYDMVLMDVPILYLVEPTVKEVRLASLPLRSGLAVTEVPDVATVPGCHCEVEVSYTSAWPSEGVASLTLAK